MRVLVVDDDPDIRLMVSVVLSREPGVEVLEAETGDEGVEVATREAPDVVLLDLMLGEGSGLDVLDRLLGEPSTREIPVVFLTGKDDRREELLRRGARAVVAKPFDPDTLVGLVARAVDG